MGLCLRRLELQYHILGWQGSTGISGSFQSESVATFDRNRWQLSTGIRNTRIMTHRSSPRRSGWLHSQTGSGCSRKRSLTADAAPLVVAHHAPRVGVPH